jgi:hypothetical protein
MPLLRNAHGLDPVGRYVLSDANFLPIRTGGVVPAVAYNSLIEFEDLTTAIAEVARVLSVDGAFCVCITHPMQYSGGFDGDDVDAAFSLRDSYFGTRPFNETEARNDITMNFRGYG